MPDDSGVTVVTTLVWFYFFPREAAGASRARHSLRPLMFRWLHVRANLRKIMRRDRGGVGGLPVVVDCQSSSLRALAKQSILARIRKLDCFVVSLLAMTAWESAAAFRRHGRARPGHPRSSLPHQRKDVDARHKAGHDAGGSEIPKGEGEERAGCALKMRRCAWTVRSRGGLSDVVIASASEAIHLGPDKKAGLLRRFTPRNDGMENALRVEP